MKNIKNLTLIALLITASLSGCKDDEEQPIVTPTETTSSFTMSFDHVWGNENTPFEMGKMIKHPMTGDSMEFTTFKYYISNVKLKDASGMWWSEDDSYHLVDASTTEGRVFDVKNVPTGEYTAIRYTHGVDSVRNFSGAQEGALSILNQMFWSWNSGYIMIKAEGNSPQANMGNFKFHLGGFEGKNNVVMNKENEFGKVPLTIVENTTPDVTLSVNPAKLWHTVGTMENKQTMIMMPGDTAKIMANDFFGSTAFLSLD
jgi:hypothetical protein